MLSIERGDVVQRRMPWDGSKQAGLPYGPVLAVVQTFPVESYSVVQLSDGRHEFDFNLQKLPSRFEYCTPQQRAG